MKAILRLTFLALFASLVDAQCNPSPCGINTRCEVSFFHNEHWTKRSKKSKMILQNLFHNEFSYPNQKIEKKIISKDFWNLTNTANVYRDLQGVYREIKVQGFQIYGDARYPKSL